MTAIFSHTVELESAIDAFKKANSFAKHVREKHVLYLYSSRENLTLKTTENGTGKYDLR